MEPRPGMGNIGLERAFPLHPVQPEETTMADEDRVEGSMKNIKGSVKETAGKVLGDSKMEAEGKMDKAKGKVQNTVGGIKDSLRDKDRT